MYRTSQAAWTEMLVAVVVFNGQLLVIRGF